MTKMIRASVFLTTALASATCLATAANAQEAARQDLTSEASQDGVDGSQDTAIVVTGSRIRRTSTDSPAPVSIVGAEQFDDRGFTSAGQALNALPSITPAIPQTDGRAQTLRNGATYPNLFNLGAGRTLTLVDGRRMVTTSSGLGDRVVDTNIIPIGLIERIDVVQAGGAAVYGSDAVAGVINYILKDDFEGIQLDGQVGLTSRGDYPEYSARLTAGQNFGGGRGNVAFNVEWSKTAALSNYDRPNTNPYTVSTANLSDTGPDDGIPSVTRLPDAHFYAFNTNGVIFTIPAPVPLPPCGNNYCFARINGTPQQFSADGQSVVAYDPGQIYSVPFANGGQGASFGDLASLFVGVERVSANALAHYDLTDNLRLSAAASFADIKSFDPLGAGQGGITKTILNNAASGAGPIAFTRNNPYLTPQMIATLSAASPSFAGGAPLFLSKQFKDLLSDNSSTVETKVYRGLVALDGNFEAGWRRFDYSLSFSHAEVKGNTDVDNIVGARFNNAINSARNASGDIVCAINAVTVVDPLCAPINPFGDGNVSQEARDYLRVPFGDTYHNKQDDFLATISGDLFKLPGGGVKFSLGYEHRAESARFDPSIAAQQGLVTGTPITSPTSGKYNTDEVSAELLLPLVGGDFTLPLVERLEVSGQYRHVDNSIAGKESVWGVNGQWEVVTGVTLRGSRSRNFRAPTLDQLFQPSTTALNGILIDPCDTRFINAGPAPATRRANCVALFAANPTFNGGNGLEGFVQANANTAGALVTTVGNPTLRNEVSDTLTYGIALQPRFIPGLTFTADRIEVDIEDGLIAYDPLNFTQACFDSSPPDQAFCSTFTRNENGDIVTAQRTTVNAANIKYRGETYKLDYSFAPGDVFGGDDLGTFGISVEATHNTRLTTVAAGVQTEVADTTILPDWVTRLDLRWQLGPVRLTYQGVYLPKSRSNSFDTIETTPTPTIPSNFRHSIGAVIDVDDNFQFRFGVINLTDKLPSYPTTNYGDILGRRFYVGARATF